MPDPNPAISDWYRALTLAERAALGIPENISLEIPEDPGTHHRLAEWRSLTAFQSGTWWAQRLAGLGLDAESFARLVALPPHRLGAEPPDWMREIGDLRPAEEGAGEPLPIPAEAGGAAGFVEILRPWIGRARLQLAADLEALVRSAAHPLPFTVESALGLAFSTLLYRLLPILSRTLVLELHVARLQGLLPGETSEERFAAFTDRLRDPNTAEAILREYPVLTRQAHLDLQLFRETSLELFSHLTADWPAIVERFFGGPNGDPGPLTGLDGGAGDRHRRGRSVRILTFASGARLVYKPRSLQAENHFQDLLAWVNAQGGHPGFRTLAVLDPRRPRLDGVRRRRALLLGG